MPRGNHQPVMTRPAAPAARPPRCCLSGSTCGPHLGSPTLRQCCVLRRHSNQQRQPRCMLLVRCVLEVGVRLTRKCHLSTAGAAVCRGSSSGRGAHKPWGPGDAPGLRPVAAHGAREQVLRRQLHGRRRRGLARAIAAKHAAVALQVQVEPVVVWVVPCAQTGAPPQPARGFWSILIVTRRMSHNSGGADNGTDALLESSAARLHDSVPCALQCKCPPAAPACLHANSRMLAAACKVRTHQTFRKARGSWAKCAPGWGGCPRSHGAQTPAAQEHSAPHNMESCCRCWQLYSAWVLDRTLTSIHYSRPLRRHRQHGLQGAVPGVGRGQTWRARGMGMGPLAASAAAPYGSASSPTSGNAARPRSPRADGRACAGKVWALNAELLAALPVLLA